MTTPHTYITTTIPYVNARPHLGFALEPVSEENWFFRLSRYADRLHALVASGALRIEPAERRNEVLAFIAGGLADFSVSRSTGRARGWGIPVPGDPGQVIYVWWDALGNYLSALGYGTGSDDLQRWWTGADRRVHLVGKGVLRFHAVYWPAILLSAGQALPTGILVHDYLTIDGRKISKSSGSTIDPAALVAQYGTAAVRWCLLREVPRVGDADFTVDRLVGRANDELANGLGNLVNRVVTLIHRYRDGQPPVTGAPPPDAKALDQAARQAAGRIESALDAFDFRRATAAIWDIIDEANRFINRIRPWELAKAESRDDSQAGADLDAVLGTLLHACQTIAVHLAPFLPDAAARVAQQCTNANGRLPAPAPIQQRLPAPAPALTG